MHIVDFARNEFGSIPPHLGGGGPKNVQLLLKINEAEKKYFEECGLEFQTVTSNQTTTAQLLFETDNDYILIVTPDNPIKKVSTLSIKRELVESMLYTGLEIQNFRGHGAGGSFDTAPAQTPAQRFQTPSQPVSTPSSSQTPK
jgi:hypothetical protein